MSKPRPWTRKTKRVTPATLAAKAAKKTIPVMVLSSGSGDVGHKVWGVTSYNGGESAEVMKTSQYDRALGLTQQKRWAQ